jgi:LPXTG-motif cell wall-anchored protein
VAGGLSAAISASAVFAAGPAVAAPVQAVSLRQPYLRAADLGPSDCAGFPSGAVAADQDGWLFRAPAAFAGLQLRFARGDGSVITVALDPAAAGPLPWGGGFTADGAELWLVTPAGWTLQQGRADLTPPSAGDATLARTCWTVRPAGPRPTVPVPIPEFTPTLAAQPRVAAAPAAAAETIKVVVGSASPTSPSTSGPSTPAPSASATRRAGGKDGGGRTGPLPKTGAQVALLALVAVLMIGLGVALRTVRRRRNTA